MLRVRRNPKTKEVLDHYERYCGRCFLNFEDQYAHLMHRTYAGKSYSRCLNPKACDLEDYVNANGAVVWKCKD